MSTVAEALAACLGERGGERNGEGEEVVEPVPF